jgi:antitoxin CptB
MTDDAGAVQDAAAYEVARATRLKRLRIRCWRRGTKEMDMLLGPFADAAASGLDEADLAALESLLSQNDQDLYAWISGARPVDPAHAPILSKVAAHHGIAAPRSA